jgi:imidazolonepropionase-like amidohydrolase
VVLGDRIEQIAANDAVVTPPGLEELDAKGRFVMPGLWDSHAHLFTRGVALLELAAGVTTVRDMGNEGDLSARVARYDAGLELGPRVLMTVRLGADFIPNAPRVANEDDARRLVETHAGRGYVQVKVLNDVDPAVVPILARLAHARGLRFSGHLPKAMDLRAFFDAGADELQHARFLFRKGPPEVDQGLLRLLAFMAAHKKTLDPTLAQFEPGPRGILRAGADVLPRLPPLARRELERDPDPADEATARTTFAAYARAVKAAADAGVQIVPGTDTPLGGFLLRRELELYVAQGILPTRVLQMATTGAARNMKRDRTSGSIAPGKDADMVVIDGDPTRDIRDLEHVASVIKGGAVMDPAELLRLAHVGPAR